MIVDALILPRVPPSGGRTRPHWFASAAAMLDVSFDQQMYDIALLLGSRLRKPIDVAILETVQSEAWRQILFSYLGGP